MALCMRRWEPQGRNSPLENPRRFVGERRVSRPNRANSCDPEQPTAHLRAASQSGKHKSVDADQGTLQHLVVSTPPLSAAVRAPTRSSSCPRSRLLQFLSQRGGGDGDDLKPGHHQSRHAWALILPYLIGGLVVRNLQKGGGHARLERDACVLSLCNSNASARRSVFIEQKQRVICCPRANDGMVLLGGVLSLLPPGHDLADFHFPSYETCRICFYAIRLTTMHIQSFTN
jgi:hypothetical protein